MSIQGISDKIKSFLESRRGHDVLLAIIFIGVGAGSFFLGRTSAPDKTPVVIKTDPNLIIATKADYTSPEGLQKITQKEHALAGIQGAFVASKKGKKYYPIDCSGAKSLKPENKIYFETAAAAEAKGYTVSTSCK